MPESAATKKPWLPAPAAAATNQPGTAKSSSASNAHSGRRVVRPSRRSRRPNSHQTAPAASSPAPTSASHTVADGMSTTPGRLMPRWLR
jgi:hypothetical protein